MLGYKWNGFIARLTNKLRYSDKTEKEEKVRNNTYGKFGVCLFCKIVGEQENMIYIDEDIAIFYDIKEDAKLHLLAVPRRHIRNINELEVKDIDMVMSMYNNGLRILQSLCPGDDYVFGFHHPPRNSIDHMHMHCVVKPFKKFKSKLSYSSMLWFITPQEVVKKIRASE